MAALGIGTPAMDVAATLCSEAAVQEPTRRQQCTSLANDLADRGTTFVDVMVASNLARRLGFPKDRQTKLQVEQRNAGMAFLAHNPWRFTNDESGFTLLSDFRCDTVLGYDDFLDTVQAAGGNVRAALAAVGRTSQGAK